MSNDRQEDRALVEACVRGSKEAWATLVRNHQKTVRFAVIRTLRNHGTHAPDELVDDLESKVFFKLVVDDFRRLRNYRAQASLKSWLRVTAVNATLDSLRRRRPTTPLHGTPDDPVESVLPDPGPLPDAECERTQLLRQMRALWQELPTADQEFVQLYFVEECSFEDIAEKLDCSAGALYARKNRIRKKLTELAHERGWFARLSRAVG